MTSEEFILEAKRLNPRVHSWCGISGSTARVLHCYTCGARIDTWAGNWRVPRHVIVAAREHAHNSHGVEGPVSLPPALAQTAQRMSEGAARAAL